MFRSITTVVALTMVSAGVSAGFAAPATPQSSDQANAKPSDYETFYRDTFRTETIKACIASAPKAAAAGFDVTPTCACASDAFLASKTLEQLVEMKADGLPQAELTAITAECLKKDPPVKRAEQPSAGTAR
jgi:hypothetical protein